MEASKLKNMVVLRNLPSNIVEEAIVILKNSKNVKKIEKIETNKNIEGKSRNVIKEKDYILKEAEMLINNYISKIEQANEKEKKNREVNKKYKKLKSYAYISSIIIIIQAILLIIKL